MNSRILRSVGGVISSCTIWIFLFCCCFTVCVTFVLVAKAGTKPWRWHSRGKESRFLHCGRCIASKACRIGSFFFTGCIFVTLLSHCPYFFRFPSVLICLFQWREKEGAFIVCQSTICRILVDSQKFVSFKFICNASFSGDFLVFIQSVAYKYFRFFIVLSIFGIKWDETSYCFHALPNKRIFTWNLGINWTKPTDHPILLFFSCTIIEGYHTILTHFSTPRHSRECNLLIHS